MSAALVTNVDARQLRKTKFPPEFNEKVDMTKVQTQIIKKWVSDEITKILNNDDDVIIELVSNMLDERYPKIKELQISLTGFLDKDAASFCHRMWKLCLSAQQSPQGIPKELLEAKKLELAQSRIEEERAREEVMARQHAERARDMERERFRERDRGERRGRGGRNDRDYRPPRHSPSPPPRRRRDSDDFYRTHPPARSGDTYRPPDRSRRPRSSTRSRSPPRRARRRSPSTRSPSPPPPRRARHRSPSTDSASPPPRRRRRRNSSSDGLSSPERRSRRGDRHPNSRRDSTPPRHSDRGPRPSGRRDLMGTLPDDAARRGARLEGGRLSRDSSDRGSPDVTPNGSGKKGGEVRSED